MSAAALLLALASLQAAPAAQESAPAPLEERLSNAFSNLEGLSGIEVQAEEGIVVLSGQVDELDARERAGEIARAAQGVLYVDNRIEVALDVSRRLEPVWQRVRELAGGLLAALPLLAAALVVLVGFVLLARFVGSLDWAFRRLTRNRLVQGILRQATRSLVVLVGVYLTLEVLGATTLVGAVFGAAGVAGIALGFAFRDIVENYLASLLLAVRRPFGTKDLVQVGEFQGTVVRLTMRETVLMTPEGNHLSLPNAMVFKSTILNFTRNPLRRFEVAVRVGFREDLASAQRLGLSVLKELSGVVADPAPSAQVERLAESNVDVRFHGWIDQRRSDFLKVRSEAIRLVKEGLERNGIELPAPSYRVHVVRTEAPAPASRDLSAVHAEARRVDVAPTEEIERLVEEERRLSTDADLLEEGDPAPAR